jgi:hypothetical protein
MTVAASSWIAAAGRKMEKFSKSVNIENDSCWWHVCDLQLAAYRSQMLDRPGPANASVADEGRGLVVPLGIQVVDGVLEHAGGGVVVLGRDEDVGVVGGDGRGPGLGVLAGVLAQHWGHRLVHVGQRVVGEVDEVVVGAYAGLRPVQHPVGDGLAVAAWAGASQDDPDLQFAQAILPTAAFT